MIDMSVGQKNIIYPGFLHGKRDIFIHVYPLLHSVIHQDMPAASLDIMTASGNLMISSYKLKLQCCFPPSAYKGLSQAQSSSSFPSFIPCFISATIMIRRIKTMVASINIRP